MTEPETSATTTTTTSLPPPVGTPVVYILGGNDVLRIEAERAAGNIQGNPVSSGDRCAAVITKRWGTDPLYANLRVHLDGDDPDMWVTSVIEGIGFYNWVTLS